MRSYNSLITWSSLKSWRSQGPNVSLDSRLSSISLRSWWSNYARLAGRTHEAWHTRWPRASLHSSVAFLAMFSRLSRLSLDASGALLPWCSWEARCTRITLGPFYTRWSSGSWTTLASRLPFFTFWS